MQSNFREITRIMLRKNTEQHSSEPSQTNIQPHFELLLFCSRSLICRGSQETITLFCWRSALQLSFIYLHKQHQAHFQASKPCNSWAASAGMSWTGMKDGWTSGSKLPAAAWKLGKHQEAQDSFVLHRMSYCDTTPVQKPFPQQLEGMLQQGCW